MATFIQSMLASARFKLIELTPEIHTDMVDDLLLETVVPERQRRASLAMKNVRKKPKMLDT